MEITHRCGHQAEHEMSINYMIRHSGERRGGQDQWVDYLASQPCPTCRVNEGRSDLPVLTGSDKQVAWALDVRRPLITWLEQVAANPLTNTLRDGMGRGYVPPVLDRLDDLDWLHDDDLHAARRARDHYAGDVALHAASLRLVLLQQTDAHWWIEARRTLDQIRGTRPSVWQPRLVGRVVSSAAEAVIALMDDVIDGNEGWAAGLDIPEWVEPETDPDVLATINAARERTEGRRQAEAGEARRLAAAIEAEWQAYLVDHPIPEPNGTVAELKQRYRNLGGYSTRSKWRKSDYVRAVYQRLISAARADWLSGEVQDA